MSFRSPGFAFERPPAPSSRCTTVARAFSPALGGCLARDVAVGSVAGRHIRNVIARRCCPSHRKKGNFSPAELVPETSRLGCNTNRAEFVSETRRFSPAKTLPKPIESETFSATLKLFGIDFGSYETITFSPAERATYISPFGQAFSLAESSSLGLAQTAAENNGFSCTLGRADFAAYSYCFGQSFGFGRK
ncbi:hypothetical protein B0H16DRAFT_1470346 [Mycena metata]|uniref:Uncharacterized protein n=1 Tax=Mycena metata TaxID=1033252 RepID=A0AAD7MRH4_9AGAR|nr:hypothetical protein B0H16DRAFT_1470346 [Mycena metata]